MNDGARLNVGRSLVVAALLLVLACISGFAGDEPYPDARQLVCNQTSPIVPFRVAYAQHFKEPDGKTLSLRISTSQGRRKTPEFLYRLGCAVDAKYRNEERWEVLIFSDYNVAKDYKSHLPDEKEPPEYLGACMALHNKVKCGNW